MSRLYNHDDSGKKQQQMITKPTVLVLGAGASAPYGLPVGAELARNIRQPNHKIDKLVQPLSLGVTTDSFRTDFKSARTSSIDKYLNSIQDPKKINLGKLLIAAHMLQAERDSKYSTKKDQNFFTPVSDWMMTLFHLMDRKANAENFGSNRLVVINFNYDRSFEWALYLHVKKTWDLSVPETMAIVNQIPVFHVYGHLDDDSLLRKYKRESFGLVPVSQPGNKTNIEYGPDSIQSETILTAASGIRTVGERTQSEDLYFIREELKFAQRVVFLGFGFDEDNINLLFPEGRHSDIIDRKFLWFASAMKMSESQKALACRFLKTSFNNQPNHIHFGNKSEDAATYLNEIIIHLVDG